MGGIRLEFELPAPPERVWPLLTDRTQLATWFMENDFVPDRGRRFMLWPGELPGIDGPISAVLLELAEPHKIMMGWQGPRSQTSMTWTLQGHRDGTRLRVTEWGHFGADEVSRERTLSRLFGVDLVALVQRQATVPAATPAAATSAGSGVVYLAEKPALSGADTPARAARSYPAAPDEQAAGSRRRRAFWFGLVALLVLAGLAVWLALPLTPVKGGDPADPGRGDLGTAPGIGSTGGGPAGSGNGDPGRGPGQSTSTGPGAGAAPTASVGPSTATTGGPVNGKPSMTVAYAFSGLVTSTVTVTVTNNGDGAGGWRAVTVRLGAANLIIADLTPGYSHVAHSPVHCFYRPQTAAPLEPGLSEAFSFKITLAVGGLLSDPVKDVTLDEMPC